jgi:hypothetical protein
MMSATVKTDLKTLQNLAPVQGSPVAPSAWLSTNQLYEIERMAAQGMSLAQIGVRMRFTDAVWADYIRHNSDVHTAYQAGAVRGVDEMSGRLYANGLAGDTGAIRYYLDRLGGTQFAPPKPAAPTIVVQNGTSVTIDQGSVPAAFDRQQALLEMEAEAESES